MPGLSREEVWKLVQLEVSMKSDLGCEDELNQVIMCRKCRNDFIQKAEEYIELTKNPQLLVEP